MGARGPIPNRDADLARPRERQGSDVQSVTHGELKPVFVPAADKDWHPIAKMLWDSLALSGQSDFYQQSDWAFAYSLCEELSLYKSPNWNKEGEEYHKRSPEMMKALLSGMSNLLITEGDRRRVRIELSKPDDGDQDATVLELVSGYEEGLGISES